MQQAKNSDLNLFKSFSLLPTTLSVFALFALLVSSASATIVRYETILGDIDVRLYDTATPASVANFRNYLNDGDWDDSFFHRSVPGFVVQGGGFTFTDEGGPVSVPTDPPVVNEFGITNIRGTLAYAKTAAGPDSATSQWFFNLADNASNLDNQNGGFTVFGRIVGNGIDIVDEIAALTRVNAGSPFDNLPVVDWTPGDPVGGENLVFVSTIRELAFNEADYNFDGVVDVADFIVWRDTLGSTTQAEADGNGDGIVDQADYALWESNFGSAMVISTTSTTVPEPSSILLLLGSAAFACRSRHR